MYLVSGNLWGVGALFFGLWLIPMGWLVLRSGWMPRPLGWVLVAGGVGYVASAFLGYLAPDASVVADALTVPASIGEFWMIGYLLIRGVTDPRSTADIRRVARSAAVTVPTAWTKALTRPCDWFQISFRAGGSR